MEEEGSEDFLVSRVQASASVLGLMAIFRLVKPRTSERNVSQLAPSLALQSQRGGKRALWNWGNFDAMEERFERKEVEGASERASEHFENEPLSASEGDVLGDPSPRLSLAIQTPSRMGGKSEKRRRRR